MKPIKFKEQNCVFAEHQPEYQSLPVYKSEDGRLISCWKFSFWERLKVLWTGRMWIMNMTFNQPLQPILPSVDSLFEKENG